MNKKCDNGSVTKGCLAKYLRFSGNSEDVFTVFRDFRIL